jgi:hypothetical protein
MTLIRNFKQTWRAASLAVLLLALAGPWAYDLINVPAEYTCNPPNMRLYGDFCGVPLTGFRLVSLMLEGFIPMTVSFFTGTNAFAERAREYFLMLLFMMPVLPPVSTILLLVQRDSRAFRVFNLVAWGLAGLLCSFWAIILVAAPYPQIWRLWGGWVYLGLSVVVLVLEISALKNGNRTGQPA